MVVPRLVLRCVSESFEVGWMVESGLSPGTPWNRVSLGVTFPARKFPGWDWLSAEKSRP